MGSIAGQNISIRNGSVSSLRRKDANELLTPIHIPTKEDENERDLLRSRSFLMDQQKKLKKHILSTCRRNNLDFKAETGAKSLWTKSHETWLSKKTKTLEVSLRFVFEILIQQLTQTAEGIKEYDEAILALSETEKYKQKKDALNCFRGIDTLTSMTLITEIGDIKRFKHPAKLTSYCGLDVAEYSSGGKEKKFGVTRMGNKRIRTSVVESCQRVDKAYTVSKRLKKHREKQDLKIIKIADRCAIRLRKKANRLLDNGKPRNKVKVACARELLVFIWEALNAIA